MWARDGGRSFSRHYNLQPTPYRSFRTLKNNQTAYATATTATTMYAATMYPPFSGVTPHLLVSQFLKVGHRVSLYNKTNIQQQVDTDR